MFHALDATAPTRDLLRLLRTPPHAAATMPESALWRAWLELRRRGEPQATSSFLGGLKALHRRRIIGGTGLPTADPDPEEHRLVDNAYVGELWRSYKRCLSANRTGPAAQILREVETQLVGRA
jgi:hypothetical protein